MSALTRPFSALIDEHQDGMQMYYKHLILDPTTESSMFVWPKYDAEALETHNGAYETLQAPLVES